MFHFDGVRGRGDGREEKGALSAAESKVTGGTAGPGCSGSPVIVCGVLWEWVDGAFQ